VFQFDQDGALAAFDGRHYFEVVPRRKHVFLRHVVEGECSFTRVCGLEGKNSAIRLTNPEIMGMYF